MDDDIPGDDIVVVADDEGGVANNVDAAEVPSSQLR